MRFFYRRVLQVMMCLLYEKRLSGFPPVIPRWSRVRCCVDRGQANNGIGPRRKINCRHVLLASHVLGTCGQRLTVSLSRPVWGISFIQVILGLLGSWIPIINRLNLKNLGDLIDSSMIDYGSVRQEQLRFVSLIIEHQSGK